MARYKCVDPSAPRVKCIECGNLVKTCEANGENGMYVCPAHPEGVQLSGSNDWVCSQKCWENAVEKTETSGQKNVHQGEYTKKAGKKQYQCSICKTFYDKKSQAKTCQAKPPEEQCFQVGDFVSVIEERACLTSIPKKYRINKGKVITIRLVPVNERYELKWLGGQMRRLYSHVYEYEVEFFCPACETTKRIICYLPEIQLTSSI